MGYITDQYFNEVECPYCKGKKLKAIVKTELIFYQEEGISWEDEMNSNYIDNCEVFCCSCGKQIN